MKKFNVQLITGLFVLLGIATFTYQAVTLGGASITEQKGYTLKAKFNSISGLRVGSVVEAAGVRVGTVSGIKFDPDNYQAMVTLRINDGVPVQQDAIASVRTQGIIGEKFIKLSAGGFPELLKDGDEITSTESALSLEELVSKYIFDSGSNDKKDKEKQ
ncbi:MAG TPA: outer membrane lipid asymmetry maintenance protein MlaD [Candidatus Acidoferrum sp.]|nr:outer membrane lipid asymmetry maintenance protein MlaD [Candidatus Acidoferrum sp.]